MEVAELLSDVGIEVAIVRCKKWDDHLLQCQAFLGASKTGRLSVGKPVWIYMTKPSSSNHFWRMEKAVEKWVVWWGRGKAQWAKVDAEDLQLHAPRVMFFFFFDSDDLEKITAYGSTHRVSKWQRLYFSLQRGRSGKELFNVSGVCNDVF